MEVQLFPGNFGSQELGVASLIGQTVPVRVDHIGKRNKNRGPVCPKPSPES